MAMGPELFSTLRGAACLLDNGYAPNDLHFALGWIRRALGDGCADEPRRWDYFSVSYVLAGTASVAGAITVVSTGDSSSPVIRVMSCAMDSTELCRLREVDSC